jgi:hypothetical protein
MRDMPAYCLRKMDFGRRALIAICECLCAGMGEVDHTIQALANAKRL